MYHAAAKELVKQLDSSGLLQRTGYLTHYYIYH